MGDKGVNAAVDALARLLGTSRPDNAALESLTSHLVLLASFSFDHAIRHTNFE